jgi:hypothetical protein
MTSVGPGIAHIARRWPEVFAGSFLRGETDPPISHSQRSLDVPEKLR